MTDTRPERQPQRVAKKGEPPPVPLEPRARQRAAFDADGPSQDFRFPRV